MAKENFCNLTCFLSAVSAGKKQPEQIGKIPDIQKKFNFKVMIFF